MKWCSTTSRFIKFISANVSTCSTKLIRLPLEDIAANNGFDVVATSCPIATSLAFTVTPVPAPILKVLSEASVPPPVKPAPAIKSLACKVSTLPSSVVSLLAK